MTTTTIFALIVFAIVYILMFTLQRIRPYIAAVGAVIVVGAIIIYNVMSVKKDGAKA